MNGKMIGLLAAAVLVVGGLVYWGVCVSGLLAPRVKGAHEDALKTVVPEDAAVIVTFDLEWFFDQAIDENFGLFEAQDVGELREELSEVSEKYFGVDILLAEHAVAWVVPENEAAALFIAGDFDGEPESDTEEEHNDVDLVQFQSGVWAAVVEGGLVLGNREGVQLAIDVSKGDADTLEDDEDALEAHQKALAEVDDGPVIVSVFLEAFADEFPEGFQELEAMALSSSVDGELIIALIGDEDALEDLVDLYEDGQEEAEDAVKALLKQVEEQEIGEGVFALTYARAKLKEAAGVTTLEQDGEVLTSVTSLPGNALLIYGAIGAAVAIPAFIKYMRRAKTVEAIDQLDRIYKSASIYYTAPRVAAGTGRKLPCQFPANQGMTPDVSNKRCCGGAQDLDNDDRCDVDTSKWTTDTWSALNFQMNEQHYFGYAFESSGTLSAARFTAKAYADLDCDGILSTFERFGYGDESASHAECSMKGSSAFYKDNETE